MKITQERINDLILEQQKPLSGEEKNNLKINQSQASVELTSIIDLTYKTWKYLTCYPTTKRKRKKEATTKKNKEDILI